MERDKTVIVHGEPQSRPLAQVCKRAKGNKSKYGVKCRHSGSCDGYKKPCKFAIY